MKLKHVVRFIGGGTPDTSTPAYWADSGTGVPWVAIGDMSSGRTVTSTAKSLSEAGVADRRLTIGDPGTILLAMYASVGAVAILGIHAVWNQALLGLIPDPTRADPRFVAYWLRYFAPNAVAEARAATQPNLNADQVANFPFTQAGVDEQRRIADLLDERVAHVDRIIAARHEQNRRIIELQRRQIMDALLTDEFAQVGVSPWFTAITGGRVTKLSGPWSVVDCKHRTPNYVESGYPVISPGDITAGRLDLSVATRFVTEHDFSDLADEPRRCLPGDVVYSRNASAGTAAYVDTDAPFTMGQDVCRITSRNENQLYLAYCLNYLTVPQLEAARVGSTFTRINVAQINGLSIPYRDPTAQAAVAARCDEIERAASAFRHDLNCSIELLAQYKRSLIAAAVTGEVDVTRAESEIA